MKRKIVAWGLFIFIVALLVSVHTGFDIRDDHSRAVVFPYISSAEAEVIVPDDCWYCLFMDGYATCTRTDYGYADCYTPNPDQCNMDVICP